MKRKYFIASTASVVFISRTLSVKAAALAKSPSWRNPAWFCTSAVVWLDTANHVYYYEGCPLYGHTEHGAYTCEKEAIAAGHRAGVERVEGW